MTAVAYSQDRRDTIAPLEISCNAGHCPMYVLDRTSSATLLPWQIEWLLPILWKLVLGDEASRSVQLYSKSCVWSRWYLQQCCIPRRQFCTFLLEHEGMPDMMCGCLHMSYHWSSCPDYCQGSDDCLIVKTEGQVPAVSPVRVEASLELFPLTNSAVSSI